MVLPNREIFINIWEFLKISIPSTCLLCFEWWTFEILTIMAGYIGVNTTAGEVILVNIINTLFMIPMGV